MRTPEEKEFNKFKKMIFDDAQSKVILITNNDVSSLEDDVYRVSYRNGQILKVIRGGYHISNTVGYPDQLWSNFVAKALISNKAKIVKIRVLNGELYTKSHTCELVTEITALNGLYRHKIELSKPRKKRKRVSSFIKIEN